MTLKQIEIENKQCSFSLVSYYSVTIYDSELLFSGFMDTCNKFDE